MSDQTLLEVRDLEVTYKTRAGDVPVVRGVSLDLQTAGTLGLAGESGCGKTTIANAVLRLLPPGTLVEGQVLLEGEDVYAMNPGRLRAVRWSELSVVFQGALHSLDPVQRVGKQIAEAIDLHTTQPRSATRKRVGELLEQVGLPARRADDYPHQLSGGQRQRVMIAMALACDPAVLIADEPTTALDVMVQAQVLDLLQRLQRERNLAVLFITHDLSVLTSVCENLAVMYAGRIVEEGPSATVFEQPQHPYTRAGRGVPDHRRSGIAHAPVGSRRRSARPAAHSERLPVPPPLRRRRGTVFDPRRATLTRRTRSPRRVREGRLG